MEVILGRKQSGYCKIIFLQGITEVYQEDCLTSADQVFLLDWYKISFQGELEL